MHGLTPVITAEAITRQAESLLMVHACALADPDTGATVALVGPSGMGKTTVAQWLGKEFAYLTDESVGMRDDLSLVPYPKPLSVIGAGGADVKDQVAPSSLGLLPPPPVTTRLAAMVLLDRQPDAPDEPVVERVRNVMAMGLLSPQISFLGRRPEPLRRIAGVLDWTGGLRKVTYRDALTWHRCCAS